MKRSVYLSKRSINLLTYRYEIENYSNYQLQIVVFWN